MAHKLNRQYIAVEQLDSHYEKTISRLEKVILGDSSALSKILKWKGGGSFVCMELKKYNQAFVDKILSAKETNELLAIWDKLKDMRKKIFFRFNVDLQKFDESLDEFKSLPLEQQKNCLVKLLDLNQLYVNMSDMEDETAQVTNEEKRISKDFYKEN